MKIPNKVKVGAKVYDVEITDKLTLGSANYSGEIIYPDLVIRICPSAKAKMEADFLHELLHGIFDHLGYTDHDEKKIDDMVGFFHAMDISASTNDQKCTSVGSFFGFFA